METATLKSTEALKQGQAETLAAPRRRYKLLARGLFLVMDLLYGKKPGFLKFKILEVIARVPYQAWEHVAYIAITHTYREPDFARRIFEFVRESRGMQDNEQWHLLILEEVTHQKGCPDNFLMHRLVPQLMAFFYYHVSWILYAMKPAWSYDLNADFEDHAEHEYMAFVRDNPGLENEPFQSHFEKDYGKFRNLADLFRQIGLDERLHKEESLERIAQARFS